MPGGADADDAGAEDDDVHAASVRHSAQTKAN
jgi:hypothetical protein